MPRNCLWIIACALLSVRAACADSPLPAADYTVARSFRLGGNLPWDELALEPGGARLFVARTDHVDVVETAGGRLTGMIAHTSGVHGVAFAPALKRGFTANSRANTISIFELDTLRVIQEVPLSGVQPEAIVYEPQHNYVIVADRESSDLTIIDAGAMRVLSTIKLPAPAEYLATDGAGHIYANLGTAPGRLLMIDAKTLTIKAKWPLKDCANPTGLALDVGNHRAFSVCANQVMAVTDAISGKSLARVVIGRGADSAAYDPDLGLVFSSNGIDGTLTVIRQDSPDEYRVVASVNTQVSARLMVLDPMTHKIYLAAAQFGPPPAATPTEAAPHARIMPDSFLILVAQPR